MKIKTGDLIRKPYPFMYWSSGEQEGWNGGCHCYEEDGAEIFEGYCEKIDIFRADAEGFIEYEVLAVVSMPRKYQDRVIYRITMIEPEGSERRSSKSYTVTANKFMKWIEAPLSPYPYEYEID